MRFVKISKSNFNLALKIAYLCFKSKKERADIRFWYREMIKGKFKNDLSRLEYFIIYTSGPVGITGFYQRAGSRNEFWLGYFGIIPKERRKGIGSRAIKETMSYAKRKGCKTFRLWATSKKAEVFYKSYGFKKGMPEKYYIYNGKKYKYWLNPSFYYKGIS